MATQAGLQAVSGNKAAALGVRLCRPGVMAAYPITPQTPLVEYLAGFVADGELDAQFVEVESEHSALSVIQGACLGGERVFTATSAVGLAYMFEPYLRTSTLRLPIVMGVANREVTSPMTVWGGQQDTMTIRDAGWIQIYVENNQEILDTIIMAFRLAEHPDVLLPVNVCYDGFYLSHLVEGVSVPAQEQVDRFLPKFSPHVQLDSTQVMSLDPLTPGDLLTRFRHDHTRAMERALTVLNNIDAEFGRSFGRKYGGALDTFMADDADLLLITSGSATGTARIAVQEARARGLRAGLVKLRSVRPFPSAALLALMQGRKAVGVLDRSVSFGWSSGCVHAELRTAMGGQAGLPPVAGFIAGLGGGDITRGHVGRALDTLSALAAGRDVPAVTWLDIPEN